MIDMIDMVVHRFWKGDPQNHLNDWTRCVLYSLGHTVREWEVEDLPREVTDIAEIGFKYLPESEHVRHLSNVVRWWALFVYGGYWADYDLIPLRSFASLPFPATANHGQSRCSSFLAFPPNHPIPSLALDHIVRHTGNVGSSKLLSGEGMLDAICTDDVARIELPIDSLGQVHAQADPWAIHLFSHGK